MKNKILSLMLIGFLSVSITACGNKGTQTASSDTTAESAEATDTESSDAESTDVVEEEETDYTERLSHDDDATPKKSKEANKTVNKYIKYLNKIENTNLDKLNKQIEKARKNDDNEKYMELTELENACMLLQGYTGAKVLYTGDGNSPVVLLRSGVNDFHIMKLNSNSIMVEPVSIVINGDSILKYSNSYRMLISVNADFDKNRDKFNDENKDLYLSLMSVYNDMTDGGNFEQCVDMYRAAQNSYSVNYNIDGDNSFDEAEEWSDFIKTDTYKKCIKLLDDDKFEVVVDGSGDVDNMYDTIEKAYKEFK